MKEVSRNTTKTATDTPEPPDMIDEGMREAVDDYSRKFLSFIQQEKDKVRKNALDESERIMADAHSRARAVVDKALKDAQAEADSITARAREQASVLTSEADRLLKAMAALREKTGKEVDDFRLELRQEADELLQAIRQRDEKINAAHENLLSEFKSSSSVVAELRQRLEQDAKIASDSASTRRHTAAAETRAKETREEPPARQVSKDDEYSRRQADKTFVGTLNLEVSKGSPALSKRFREALSKVAGLEISVADDSAKDKTKIVAFASRPLPLLSILHQMTLVKTAVADDDGIRVMLQETDQWVG